MKRLGGIALLLAVAGGATGAPAERTYLFTLKVLTLNTWLLQGFLGIGGAPDRNCRAQELGLALGRGDYDVILLQEVFDKRPGDALFCGACAAGACAASCRDRSFRSRFPALCSSSEITGRVVYPAHFRRYPVAKGLELNGGLGILSKYPIVFQHNEPWKDCGGVDCFAQKGFFHARIAHPLLDVPLELVTLHTNANYHTSTTYADARRSDLQQLRRELDRYPNAPMIVGGDFNIVGPPCAGEACEDLPEYFTLKPTLAEFNDAWAELHPEEYGFTADDRRNANRKGTRQERIDYLWSTDAGSCYEVALVETHVEEFPSFSCSSGNLSDHFGLAATFQVSRREGCRAPE